MTHTVATVLTVLAALGCGLVAGIFFAFSNFVMTALGRLAADWGIVAMQTINMTVINPGFFAVFFGTAALCLLLIGLAAFTEGGGPGQAWVVAGCLLYLAGCIGVTVACNVPLNNRLAAVEAGSGEGAELWARYRQRWTAWNHVRSLASLAAAACFLLALRS